MLDTISNVIAINENDVREVAEGRMSSETIADMRDADWKGAEGCRYNVDNDGNRWVAVYFPAIKAGFVEDGDRWSSADSLDDLIDRYHNPERAGEYEY